MQKAFHSYLLSIKNNKRSWHPESRTTAGCSFDYYTRYTAIVRIKISTHHKVCFIYYILSWILVKVRCRISEIIQLAESEKDCGAQV